MKYEMYIKYEFYTTYAAKTDMTFIMRTMFCNGEAKEEEVVGWYYGEPNEDSTAFYIGKLKARFDL